MLIHETMGGIEALNQESVQHTKMMKWPKLHLRAVS